MFGVNIFLQKCRDSRRDVFAYFIDYKTVFDKVKHDILINKLKDAVADGKDIRLIRNLYWRQAATAKIRKIKTNQVSIQGEVRQGCILLYFRCVLQESLKFK